MAKNRTKRKKALPDPIRDLTRIIHSSANLTRGITKARSKMAPALAPQFLDRLYDNAVFRGVLQKTLFPKAISVLGSALPLHTPNEESDIIWTARICGKHSGSLREFVDLRNFFNNAFLVGNIVTAKEVLQSIFEKFGYSFWYLDNKFQLLQAEGGLALQKEFLSELISTEGINPWVAYFCYVYSLKAEPHVSAHLMDEMAEGLEGLGFTERLTAVFRYLINPLSVGVLKNPFLSVHAAENTSLIDRYQVLVRVLLVLSARNFDLYHSLIGKALDQLADIPDCFANTLRLLHGKVIGPEEELQLRTQLKGFDAYTSGEYALAVSDAAGIITGRAAETPLLELFVRGSRHMDQPYNLKIPADCSAAKALGAMDDITCMGDDYEQAFGRADKLALNHGHMLFGIQLLAFSKRTHAFGPGSNYTDLDKLWALSSPLLNPWHYDILKAISSHAPRIVAERAADSVSYRLRMALSNEQRDAGEQEIAGLDIPLERKRDYLGQLAMSHRSFPLAAQRFRENCDDANLLTKLSARAYLFKALIEMGELEACLKLVLDSFHEQNTSISQYDIGRLVSLIKDDAVFVSDKLLYCNLLSLAIRYFSLPFEPLLSDAFEDALDERGVERPSQLLSSGASVGRSELIYFLAHVCTVRTMEDCTNFRDMDDIDEERIKICGWLVANDDNNKASYSSEIRNITRSSKMISLRRKISDSKMYVDEAGIAQLLHGPLLDGFNRYKALLKSPDVNFQAEQITFRMGKLLETRDTLESSKAASDFKRLKLPSTERLGLLRDMYEALLDRFLFSPEYGLDTNLSANVRHGTFVGQIRSSLAEKHLVTPRDKITKVYENNEFWMTRHAALDETIRRRVNELLSRFAERVDKLFNHTNDELLHVHSDRKPEGLFRFSEVDEVLGEVAKSIDADTQFDEFVGLLFEAAWRQASLAMEGIRQHLTGDFAHEALRYLDMLSHDLEAIVARENIAELADAVAKARTDFHSAVGGIADWFRVPSRIDDEPYAFDVIVDVAESEIRSCFGGQKIVLGKEIAEFREVGGRKVFGFIEVIFILLQNAIIHCGSSESRDLVIDVKQDDDGLKISVSNGLADHIDLNERRTLAAEAVARYSAKSAIERVRTEGGSGLSKIWRTAEYTIRTTHGASMHVHDSRTFTTSISMDSAGIFA
ncbi:hypothetical protein FJW08_26660 [Mesorhizobium sp. B3-2-1]|uniref:hypothetical protein n=1 Tax=Mesorhizobium sp. B3-2-1 TaxID=2589891 RepID=UPI00112A8992|nr:hypothetical protein [Mesorhizobium sp. B3-2-1]TPI26813.1 hypothetical protein FJW08_26660 [Mesorhizobium sp. B3-2-1]